MTDRDRLIELLEQAKEKAKGTLGSMNNGFGAWYADYLLANGVIVPLCKVGDTVWVLSHWYKYTKPEIESRKILSVQIYKNSGVQYHYKDGCFWKEHIGNTVFLTKEEAEKALAERSGDNA